MTGARAHLITLWISILLPAWAHGRFETMKWKWLCIHYFSCYDQILARALKGGRFILAHSLKGYSLSQKGRYGGRLLDSTTPSSNQAGTFHFLEFCPAWKELSYSLWLSDNWNNGSKKKKCNFPHEVHAGRRLPCFQRTSQHPYSSSQLSVTPVPENLMCSDLCGHQEWFVGIHAGETPIDKVVFF